MHPRERLAEAAALPRRRAPSTTPSWGFRGLASVPSARHDIAPAAPAARQTITGAVPSSSFGKRVRAITDGGSKLVHARTRRIGTTAHRAREVRLGDLEGIGQPGNDEEDHRVALPRARERVRLVEQLCRGTVRSLHFASAAVNGGVASALTAGIRALA